MLQRQETEFKQHGGVRERMFMARTAQRADEWKQRCHDYLNQAADLQDLMAKADEIKRAVDESVRQIKPQRGWD